MSRASLVRPDGAASNSAGMRRPSSATQSRPTSGSSSRPTSASRRNALAGPGSTSAASLKRGSVSAQRQTAIVPQGAGNMIKLGGARGKHNMTDEMKKEFTETFALLDDMHEGAIAAPKILIALKVLGFEPTAAATERADGDPLDLNEYMSFVLSCSQSQSEWCTPEMEEVFALFDRENVGYLAAAQFKRTFGRLGEKLTDAEIEDQMDDFDLNDDFNLEKKNFFKMLLSNENR